MTIHLLRPAVGSASIEDLVGFFEARGTPEVPIHTRRAPTRQAELLDGGSVYWVIKGQIRCRAPIRRFETATYPETGETACRIWLGLPVVPVLLVPHRPFQGWRYLDPAKAPPDAASVGDLPPELASELRALGLL